MLASSHVATEGVVRQWPLFDVQVVQNPAWLRRIPENHFEVRCVRWIPRVTGFSKQ